MKTNEYNKYGEELEKVLHLRTFPLAIKFLEKEEDVPAGAVRPKKDNGEHIAFCQALAASRRRGDTILMTKEDHWCWNPLIGIGHVECKEGSETFNEVCKFIGIEDYEKAKAFFKDFPRLEYGKYFGVVTAPLSKANFEPDVVIIYSNPAQLRSMIWAVKFKTGKLIDSQFDAIDSCVYSIVSVFKSSQYRVTVPDPGEYERAMAYEEEIIFSVPKDKLKELIDGLRFFTGIKMGYTNLFMEMRPDFPRPPFYNNLFKMWGLDQGKDWKK